MLFALERLQTFGPDLGAPHTSRVLGTPFRELRTTFAGQQYRVLYIQDNDEFIVFNAFHKTSDKDLSRAVREAEKFLEEYRRE